MERDIELDVDSLIEKKFKDIKLETKTIAFAVRRDFNTILQSKKDFFTIEPYRKVYEIITRCKAILPQDVLYKYIKREVPEEERDIFKTYVERIYDENLRNIDRKSISVFVETLKTLYESRIVLKGINDVLKTVETFDIHKAKKTLRSALMTDTQTDRKNYGEYLEDMEDRMAEIKRKRDNPRLYMGVPTGLRELDNLSGGLQKGELGIIVAGTGVGKSLALGNLALNAWKLGYNVLFVSLEMTKHQIEFRFDSRVTRINHTKFRKAEVTDDEMDLWKQKLQNLRQKKTNYLELVCMPRGCTSAEIEEEALKIQAKRKAPVELIIVDYINLMSSNDKRHGDKKDWKNQAEVGWNLKELCMEFNGLGVPIWTANQLTDEGNEAEDIKAHHLKYARAISEVASLILALNQSDDDILDGIMKLWFVKVRDFANIKKPIKLHPNFNIMLLDADLHHSGNVTLHNVTRGTKKEAREDKKH